MKQTYLIALLALAILVAPAALYAADTYCSCEGSREVCRTCPAPAWDRTPICVQETTPACAPCGAGPKIIQVDPWDECGAFCAAGNIPVGWPYGWTAEYWLRPDSNF